MLEWCDLNNNGDLEILPIEDTQALGAANNQEQGMTTANAVN